jgi:hypothetical protein
MYSALRSIYSHLSMEPDILGYLSRKELSLSITRVLSPNSAEIPKGFLRLSRLDTYGTVGVDYLQATLRGRGVTTIKL